GPAPPPARLSLSAVEPQLPARLDLNAFDEGAAVIILVRGRRVGSCAGKGERHLIRGVDRADRTVRSPDLQQPRVIGRTLDNDSGNFDGPRTVRHEESPTRADRDRA